MSWWRSPLALAGTAFAVSVTSAVVLGVRRRSTGAGEVAKLTAAVLAVARVPPGAAIVLREHLAANVIAERSVDPYSLVSAVAMCRTILRMAGISTAAQNSNLIRRGNDYLGAVVSSTLTEREKVRALVLGLGLSFLVSSDGSHRAVETEMFHFEAGTPMLYAYANSSQPGGTPMQQSRIAHAILWCGYYLTAPMTACARKGADLLKHMSALPVGGIDLPLSTWRDSEWILGPGTDQRWRAVIDLYWAVVAGPYGLLMGSGGDPTSETGCAQYEPNPCLQLIAWGQELTGYISDARELSGMAAGVDLVRGLNVAAVEGAIQSTLQLLSRALVAQAQPYQTIPPRGSDPFALIATVIGAALSAVATVFSAGAASGLLAASVASYFAIVAGAASTAIALAQAVHGSASVADAVHGVMVSSFGQQLTASAAMLLPDELKEAAKIVGQSAAGGRLSLPKELRSIL